MPLRSNRVRLAESGVVPRRLRYHQQVFPAIPVRLRGFPLNFYRRFPGDYARDTKHLTLAEHGAYTLLLDYYYSTEKPIPSLKLACAICNARTGGEVKVVKKVLAYFFKQRGKGWVNHRAEVELSHANDKRKAAQNSANQRWKRSDGNANASDSQYENHAMPHRSRNAPRHQTPDTIKRAEEEDTAAAFAAIGFDKPFGHQSFQDVFLSHWAGRIGGEWVTQIMEHVIQDCQTHNIRIPPQFYEAKRDVEARENASIRKAPL